MTGNPLISREKCVAVGSLTLLADASLFSPFLRVRGVLGADAERLAVCHRPLDPLVSRYLLGRNAEALREYGHRPRVRFLHFSALDTGDLLWGKAVEVGSAEALL